MSKRFFTPIDFTNTAASSGTVTPVPPRQAQWDYGDGTLQIGLEGGNVKLSVGQEQVVKVYNGTGSALVDGQVVYIKGAQGQRPSVGLALATTDETSSKVLGVVTEPIANGAEGFVATMGIVKDMNTASFAEGSKLWLSPTSSGALTTTMPVAPNHAVFIGYSLKSNASSGQIFVNPQNGYEIDELHNVNISNVSNNDVLLYDSSASYWKNTNFTSEVHNSGSAFFGNANVYVQDSAPSSPDVNDIWYNTTKLKTYVWYDNYWIEIGVGGIDVQDGVPMFISETQPVTDSNEYVWFKKMENGNYDILIEDGS